MTHIVSRHRLAGISVAALLVAAITTSAVAQDKKFKAVSVKTPDGLTISAQDWGNPRGPEILFIHGFSQSHLSWVKQVTNDDLAKEFHMVTYDLRGHGNSDKPFEPERYKDSKAWGDEVQAVMDATGLKRPVLVGWSYGGRVMADYLKTHGTAKLSGLTHGSEDKNSNLIAAEYTAKMIAGAKLSVYQGIGHSPFFEDAPRFNAELATFVRSAQKAN